MPGEPSCASRTLVALWCHRGSASPRVRISSKILGIPSPSSCPIRMSEQTRAIRGFLANLPSLCSWFGSMRPGNEALIREVVLHDPLQARVQQGVTYGRPCEPDGREAGTGDLPDVVLKVHSRGTGHRRFR